MAEGHLKDKNGAWGLCHQWFTEAEPMVGSGDKPPEAGDTFCENMPYCHGLKMT